METINKEYLSCHETAKLIRNVVSQKWPSVKFSVRSKIYSGGASITIYWTDGPSSEEVNAVAKLYEGAEFDAMVDLKSYKESILVGPDGMRKVHFGADYVFTSRSISNFEVLAMEAENLINAKCVVKDGKFGCEWIQHLATSMIHYLSFTRKDTMEKAFDRIVMRKEVA